MKVLILKPRLDVMFKKSIITKHHAPIPPVRVHWNTFVNRIYCNSVREFPPGTDFYIHEAPLWQFTPQLVDAFNADLALIPHKERRSFECKTNALYYMQTVFPWRFYVDPMGFAGGSTLYRMDISDGDENGPWFDALRNELITTGKSKFDQPAQGSIDISSLGEYVLFPCQIPHDETIKYHSNVTVEEALTETCQVTAELGLKLVVKGHPVNPNSMASLLSIVKQYPHVVWLDNVNIHDVISHAKVVVVVNSGTGMEALLHKKPVITYGRAEYNCVTMKAILNNNLRGLLIEPVYDEKQVKKFFDKWCKSTYDTRCFDEQRIY